MSVQPMSQYGYAPAPTYGSALPMTQTYTTYQAAQPALYSSAMYTQPVATTAVVNRPVARMVATPPATSPIKMPGGFVPRTDVSVPS